MWWVDHPAIINVNVLYKALKFGIICLKKSITDLEIKFSHQDFLLDQLNRIVADQQLAIEKLQQEIKDIKLSQSDGASAQRTLEDDIPPHY